MVAEAITSYGSALLGRASWKEANRNFIAGAAGIAGGHMAGTLTTSLVATYGTCSTGTAISSLSGAAQANAILAWLGGGATSAGGFGVVGGVVVLGGILIVVSIGVTCTVTWVFVLHDKKERRRYSLILERKMYPLWDKIAINRLNAIA